MNLTLPPALKKGDTIAIVCTARKISKEDLQPAISEIENRGYKVILGDTIGLEDNQFAGTDAQRVNDFQKQLDVQQVKAIFCARGGYGTVRVIDAIDFSSYLKNPKWIVGYSDITVLHSHINKNLNTCSLHATMPVNFQKNSKEAIESLFESLEGKKQIVTIATNSANKIGVAKGQLIGGNLSVLFSLLGSKSDIDTRGKILFLEDLDEYLYHVDRMMMAFKRAGKLDSLAGLIIGGMSDMRDNTITFGKTAHQIIAEAVAEYTYPVCFDFPAGHIDDNRALVFGSEASLEVTKDGSVLKF